MHPLRQLIQFQPNNRTYTRTRQAIALSVHTHYELRVFKLLSSYGSVKGLVAECQLDHLMRVIGDKQMSRVIMQHIEQCLTIYRLALRE